MLIKGVAFDAFSDRTLGIILFITMKNVLIFSLFILIIISCKKKSDNPESSCSSNDWDYQYIDGPLNDFFFKEGSYWIYKNDSLNSLDSVILKKTESGCEPVYYYQGRGTNWQYYTLFYYSYPSGTHYYDMIEGEVMMRNRHPSQYVAYQGWILYSTLDTSLSYWLPKHLDSLKVGNHTFYNVQLSKNLFGANDNTDIYTADKIGIIKKVDKNSSSEKVWNLIRWKINK